MSILLGSGSKTLGRFDLVMTAGNDGGTNKGYRTTLGTFGSLSSDTVRGQTILDIYTFVFGLESLLVSIDADVPQNFFSSIDLTDAGISVLYSKDAEYNTGGGTTWQWDSGAELPGSGTVNVIFIA